MQTETPLGVHRTSHVLLRENISLVAIIKLYFAVLLFSVFDMSA